MKIRQNIWGRTAAELSQTNRELWKVPVTFHKTSKTAELSQGSTLHIKIIESRWSTWQLVDFTFGFKFWALQIICKMWLAQMSVDSSRHLAVRPGQQGLGCPGLHVSNPGCAVPMGQDSGSQRHFGCSGACRLKLPLSKSVKIVGQQDPLDIECAYVSFCYEIKLESSCL